MAIIISPKAILEETRERLREKQANTIYIPSTHSQRLEVILPESAQAIIFRITQRQPTQIVLRIDDF